MNSINYKEFDLISKKRRIHEEHDLADLPEMVYAKSLEIYQTFEKTGEMPEYNWSSIFLKQIGDIYNEKLNDFRLLSFVEFTLYKDVYKSKKFEMIRDNNELNKVFSDQGQLIIPRYQYDYPIESEYSKKLLNIILNYLYHNKLELDKEHADDQIKHSYYCEVDSYTKALLKNFMMDYANREIFKDHKNNTYGFIGYPAILFGLTRDILIIMAIKPLNGFQVDESINDLEKIFDISIGFYSNTRKIYKFEYKDLLNQFRAYSMFIYQKELEKNINDSIAEASLIARYWYTEGLRNITEKQEKINRTTDSFNFSEVFIKEILSADIEGVNNIEIYPFDRCFIFKDSALSKKPVEYKDEEDLPLVICEASLLKKSISEEENIKQQNNYVYEWDRLLNKIPDFDIDYSRKKVEFNDWWIDYKNRQPIERSLHESFSEFKQNDAKAIDFMLYNLICKKANTKQLLELEKEYFSNEDGLCYIYLKNVDLKLMPMLKNLQEKYLKEIYKDVKRMNEFLAKVDTKNAKIVFISYDPSKVKTKNDLKIDQKHAFSILIIADADIQKSIMEIQSEKEDLRTAIKLIVRQKTEAAELVKMEREKQKNFISRQLKVTMHGIKGRISDHTVKNELDQLIRIFDNKLKEDTLELKPININQSSSQDRFIHLFQEITKNTFDEKDGKLWDLIIKQLLNPNYQFNVKRTICNNSEQIDLIVYESFLPEFSILMDEITLQEAFHILLKNTVEEARTTEEKLIAMQVYIVYNQNEKGYLNIQFVNSCQPISEKRMIDMNTAKDEVQINENKEGSTGLGVASARSQLLSRFGEEATIIYKLLSKKQIATTLTMPIVFLQNNNNYETDVPLDESQENCRVIYLEDDKNFYENSCKYLDEHFNLNYIHMTNTRSITENHWENAEVLFADLSVPKFNGGESKRTNGINAIIKFYNIDQSNTVFVMSNEDVMDIKKAILDESKFSKRISEDNIELHFDEIEKGKIYIASNIKSIRDLAKSHPDVVNFLERYNEEKQESINNLVLTGASQLRPAEIESIDKLKEILDEIAFNKYEELYLLKQIRHEQIAEVFNLWTKKRIYIPDDKDEENLSNPDIFDTLMMIQLNDYDAFNSLDAALFGLKNNLFFLPSSNSIILQKCIDIISSYRGRISLKSNGILSALNHDLAKHEESYIKKIREKIISSKTYNNSKNYKLESLLQVNTDLSSKDELHFLQDVQTDLEIFIRENNDLALQKHVENLAFCIELCKTVTGGL